MSRTNFVFEIGEDGLKKDILRRSRRRVLNLPLAEVGDSHRNRKVIEENRRIQDKVNSYKETVH